MIQRCSTGWFQYDAGALGLNVQRANASKMVQNNRVGIVSAWQCLYCAPIKAFCESDVP